MKVWVVFSVHMNSPQAIVRGLFPTWKEALYRALEFTKINDKYTYLEVKNKLPTNKEELEALLIPNKHVIYDYKEGEKASWSGFDGNGGEINYIYPSQLEV